MWLAPRQSLCAILARRFPSGALAAAVFMIPDLWMMDGGRSPTVWFGVILPGGCIDSALAGRQPAFFFELFPANERATGVADAREFGAIAAGAIA